MKQQGIQSTPFVRMKRLTAMFALVWTCIIVVFAVWELYSNNQGKLDQTGIWQAVLLSHSLLWGVGLLGMVSASRRIITDMRQQEITTQALHENIAQYHAITSTAMDGFWVAAPDGRLLDVNAAYCRMIGYSRDELLTMSIVDIEAEESPAEIRDHLRQMIEAGAARFETRHRCKDGRLIDIEVSTTFVAELDYFCSFLRDITARKQTEMALRESEERLRQIVENMPVMLDAFDEKSNIIAWNRECERVTGYSAEELVGNPHAMELLYPDTEYRERVNAESTALGFDFRNKEYTLTCKDGTKKTINWSNISGRCPLPGWHTWAIGLDITDLKRSEVALRESEARYRVLVDASPTRISVMQNGFYVFTNPAGAAILGYDNPDDAVGKSLLDTVSPDYVDIARARIANLENGNSNPPAEIELIRSDGSTVLIESTSVPIVYQGEPAALIIGQDITERKQTEKNLQQERDRAQQYLDIAGVMFVALNTTGEVTLINRQGSHILGYAPQETIGKDWFDNFLPEPIHEQMRTIFDRLMADEIETDEYYENPILRKDDGERIIAWHNAILKDDAGQIIGTLSSGEDITERRQAEQILQVRLRLSEYAITHSIDDLMQKTLDEAEQLTHSQIGFFHFLDADQKTLTLQVWSTNTQTTMCSAEGKGRHYAVNEAGVWVDCIRQRAPVIHNDYASLPHRQGMPEGHTEVIREIVVPIMRNDLIVGILGVGNKSTDYDATDTEMIYQLANLAWDIVALKKVELALGESKETIALKDRFISTVSHEFRTPLAIIQTSSDLLTHYADRLTEARRQQSFQQITQQIAVLTGLIDGVLSINRSQTGRIEFAPTPVDLEPFCRTVFEQIQFTDKSEHQFEFISHAPDRAVLVDGTLLQHILTNLLTNAVKYSPEKSRITFELGHTDTDITIKVSDEGIGISEEDRALLFEPFYRAGNVGHVAGTGLGLSIVKEYVALHGGRVEVESQLGTGSIFTVLLPLK